MRAGSKGGAKNRRQVMQGEIPGKHVMLVFRKTCRQEDGKQNVNPNTAIFHGLWGPLNILEFYGISTEM